jgi:hypothetical protein
VPDELGVILPPGVRDERAASSTPDRALVVNETDLPDQVVQRAVMDYVQENASVLGVSAGSSFGAYANEGSLLARTRYRTPGNVMEEIRLARDMAERDDDVAPAIGAMIATAFSEGMAHIHRDPVMASVFDEIAANCNLDEVWAELYREWLIASGVTTATVYTRESFSFVPDGESQQRTRDVVAPLIGVLPAEQIRVIGSDLFRTGTLALKPANGAQESFLRELHDPKTTEARRRVLRERDPVMAALTIGRIDVRDPFPGSFLSETNDPAVGDELFLLNPRLVIRSTMAKGAWSYPRPVLTRNFALLEAKRLLNIMDYALLQGGSNYLVIAKKGTDQKPAKQSEVDNLYGMISRASRTGVLVGDHRLDVQIVTPELKELLNPEKRNLLGRKLANAMLRVPELDEDAGGEGQKTSVEIASRVVTYDRKMLKRHVEKIYAEVVRRNSTIQAPARIWFPKIILQGTQWFTDYVLKLRDRGDISRKTAVGAGGFDYDAEVARRRLEKPDDRVMVPAAVPFDSPNRGAGPQDNGTGRPRGTSNGNGSNRPQQAAAGRPRRVIGRNAGETVTAMFEEEIGTFRMGEITHDVLEEYAASSEIGRTTAFERTALAAIEEGDFTVRSDGPITVVPVNEEHAGLEDIRVVRLADGLSVLVGSTVDDARVARAFVFRRPVFDELAAQEFVLGLGFQVHHAEADAAELEEHAALPAGEPFEIHIHAADGRVTKQVPVRDEQGAIIEVRTVPVDAEPGAD